MHSKQPVEIPYARLLSQDADLSGLIEKAAGADGLGILSVSGVPGFMELRSRLLHLASEFAALPAQDRQQYEDPASHYNFGWSHGKESLQTGHPDTHKGSYYANPLEDDPAQGNAALMQQHPAYFRPNIWPTQHLPAFEQAFKELGQLIVHVGMLLTSHCDKYASQKHPRKLPTGKLSQVLRQGRNHKGRLLHYFPQQLQHEQQQQQQQQPSLQQGQPGCLQDQQQQQDQQHKHGRQPSLDKQQQQQPQQQWCGWHTDHGSLTGLTPALYMRGSQEVANPDPHSGLYVRDRHGCVVKVVLPPDHVAFQVGEAMQVHSGGALRATPHCVRAASGPSAAGVARNAFAVFMQPDVTAPMDAPEGVSAERIAVGQWRPGQTFGEFSESTFMQYYS